ncbi:DoxX family protein [Lederbergia citrea]|uniref:DoxX family protein n=1 Tax=Lederbergia citrea TaxID=2833581 RepID=A0A942Z770_9BACI|nr:DoxX family protein [Lederbergia citrea]MBS4224821.1 DoxX family protein [Lederbergia citrea]
MIKNEIGQIILRVGLGLIFFAHGLSKFQGGINNTVGFFDSIVSMHHNKKPSGNNSEGFSFRC